MLALEPPGRALSVGSCGTPSLTCVSHTVIDDPNGKKATADGRAVGHMRNNSTWSWHLSLPGEQEALYAVQ